MSKEIQNFFNFKSKLNLSYKIRTLTFMITSGFLCLLLFQKLTPVNNFESLILHINNRTTEALISLSFLFALITVWFIINMIISNLRKEYYKRKYVDRKKYILHKVIKYTRETQNYDSINQLFKDKNAHLYIIDIAYYVSLHFKGSWLDESKIIYPNNWNKKTISKIVENILNLSFDENDIQLNYNKLSLLANFIQKTS